MIVESSRRLPEKASLDQLRKQAKELKASGEYSTLSDAQLGLARNLGFDSWPKLKLAVEQSKLRQLIQDGEAAPVLSLLESNPRLASTPFAEGDTPLHVAAEENRPDLVEMLVCFGAKTSLLYAKSAHSPLSWALTNWSFGAAEKLVELGVEPDLFCAAGLGDLKRVRSFWMDGKLKPNASQTGSSRMTPNWERLPFPPEDPKDQISDALYIACRTNRLEVSRFLLQQGADPNFRAYVGGTCLHWAEFSQNPELCRLLREHGGSDEMQDYAYRAPPQIFPVMVFAGWGFETQLASLLQTDLSQANVQTEFGTPLHAAASGGNERCARMLLLAGVDKTIRNGEGKTALDLATDKGHETIAALLR